MTNQEKTCPYKAECKYFNDGVDEVAGMYRRDGVFMRDGFRKAWCDSTGRNYDECPLEMYHHGFKGIDQIRKELIEIMERETIEQAV